MFNTQARVTSDLCFKKGFTLLELVFALAVISILILLGISHYKRYSENKDFELVKYNVDQLFLALNQCVWMNHKNNPIGCNKQKLQDLKIWPSLFLKNNKLTPSDDNYDVGVNDVPAAQTGNFIVTVFVTFPYAAGNSDLLKWYIKKLNATFVSDVPGSLNTLIWNRLLTNSVPNADTKLWINNAQLQQFKNIEQE